MRFFPPVLSFSVWKDYIGWHLWRPSRLFTISVGTVRKPGNLNKIGLLIDYGSSYGGSGTQQRRGDLVTVLPKHGETVESVWLSLAPEVPGRQV